MYIYPSMKKQTEPNDELRPEYDLKSLLKGAVRGKYAQRYAEGTNLVLLEPDVAQAFPNEKSVNEALRLVMKLTKVQESPGRAAQQRQRQAARGGGGGQPVCETLVISNQ